MLNKKGFTVAEVVVSFSLVSVILVSLISTVTFYRDKMKEEEVKTQLIDFKNTVTKTVYDDIVNYNIVRAESCIGADDEFGIGSGTCINLIDVHGEYHTLKIVENPVGENVKRGVYLSYDGVKYWLPDSDLGTGSERICDFVGNFDLQSYNDKIYRIKLSFRHKDLDVHYNILFTIN